jgi:hypothetical protein
MTSFPKSIRKKIIIYWSRMHVDVGANGSGTQTINKWDSLDTLGAPTSRLMPHTFCSEGEALGVRQLAAAFAKLINIGKKAKAAASCRTPRRPSGAHCAKSMRHWASRQQRFKNQCRGCSLSMPARRRRSWEARRGLPLLFVRPLHYIGHRLRIQAGQERSQDRA